ncbi:MAG: IS66 family transposase [Sphingomicrobium sp.]
MKALVLALLERNRLLEARVAELEARLGPPKTPDNSSLPPSRGQKANRVERPPKPRPARPGVTRQLCPAPDQVRQVFASACAACGHGLAPADQPEVHAYDHIDLPAIKPVVTRIALHGGRCPGCGAKVRAKAPADMAPGSPFGPGIQALAVYLHVRHMVSFSRLVEMFHGLFGLTLSEGAIANLLGRAAPCFEADALRIEAEVRQAPVIACDETSARIDGVTCWQWVFASAHAVAHRIAISRSAAVASDFLAGAKPQVWVSDRLAAQSGHGQAHQVCLAHLLRDAQYAIDAGDGVFAPGFKFLLKRALAIARRRDRLSDATLIAYGRDLDARLAKLLALEPDSKAGAKLAKGIAKCRDKLFVFLTRRDVPPTNNVSERALRPSVIFRKVTNGFRSAWGAKLYADICSVIATGLRNGATALAAIRTCLAGQTVLNSA